MAGHLRTVLGIQSRSSDEAKCHNNTSGGNIVTQTRPVDLKDDSTISGSVPSKSDRSESGASDHEGPLLDNLEPQSASMLWLGPEPSTPQNEASPEDQILSTRR